MIHLQPPAVLNIMIGVAGHIDHGKTELVKMLTGCDTDRLKEEKERGMSIELGYAPCYLAAGRVGIVDVPGHEKFVRKMVAAAMGIDIALLVVAADDGVMPQTREHLDIVELLGVRHLLVALNKTDLVTPDRLEDARGEVRNFLAPTPFADASLTPVSSLTGEGVDALRERIAEAVEKVERRKTGGVFRLPIDRIFSSPGHGTVVTGIAASGAVKSGDAVEILPIGKTARVRSVQMYLSGAETGNAGQCVALNLGGVHPDELERGFVACAPGRFGCHVRFTTHLRASRFLDKPLTHAVRIHFHTGTSETPGKVRLLVRDELQAGEEAFAQIELDRPVCAFLRDRFLLRLESPAVTLAGGVILECRPPRCKRRNHALAQRLEERRQALDSDSGLILSLLEEKPFSSFSEEDLAQAAGLRREEVIPVLAELESSRKILRLNPRSILSCRAFSQACDPIENMLRDLHQRDPRRFGFSAIEIAQSLPEAQPLLEPVLARMVEEKRVIRSGTIYRSARAPGVDPRFMRLAARVEEILIRERFQTPSPKVLSETVKQPLPAVEAALRFLVETGRIVRLAESVYLHDEHVRWARDELIAAIRRDGPFATHLFKNLIQSSRKYAIPLLDYFDEIGVTRRVGGFRHLGEPGEKAPDGGDGPRTNR
ncbi:MAG: selenocysteine-specific translation elongation factor [bacterium]